MWRPNEKPPRNLRTGRLKTIKRETERPTDQRTLLSFGAKQPVHFKSDLSDLVSFLRARLRAESLYLGHRPSSLKLAVGESRGPLDPHLVFVCLCPFNYYQLSGLDPFFLNEPRLRSVSALRQCKAVVGRGTFGVVRLVTPKGKKAGDGETAGVGGRGEGVGGRGQGAGGRGCGVGGQGAGGRGWGVGG